MAAEFRYTALIMLHQLQGTLPMPPSSVLAQTPQLDKRRQANSL